MDVEAASWTHAGLVPPGLGQNHDRGDSPMPDVPPEPNLVRVTSNGSSIISGGSDLDVEIHGQSNRSNHHRDDAADEIMTDAAVAAAVPNTSNDSSMEEPPPPPPPPEPPQSDAPANANTNENSPPKQDDTDHIPWSPIFEDTSPPGMDELKRLESSGETSALDHKYWEKKIFKDLEDPAYTPVASGRIEWTVEKFNGTQEKPNKDLLRHSDPVKIGDHHWRIKLYPKGNGTSYVGAYLECVDFVESSCKSANEASENKESTKKEKFSNELLDAPMPTIGKEQLRRPVQVPAQLMIIMYNPQEPRVHFHKKTTHAFTPSDPDRGFSRFGPSPIYDLGLRHPETRQAMLRNDNLSFIAHVRTFKDPTGFLFVREDYYDYRRDFARTGLRPIRVPPDLRGFAANLAAAVVTWSLLPMMRSLIYRGSSYDLSNMPLTKALQEFLAHWRRQPPDDPDAPPIAPAPMEKVAKALHWHGSCHAGRSCQDPTHCHGSTEFAPDDARVSLRKPWHPAGRGMQEFDVFQTWEFLLDGLDSEWRGTEMSGTLQKIFEPNGFRVRLSTKSTNVQSALFYQTMKGGQRTYPPVLQVELPRSTFDDEKRKWRKTDDKIAIGQTIKLSKDESGWYSLYGLILHDGGLASRQYTPIVRPDGKNWFKATTSRTNRMTRITEKQAVTDNEQRAYIAIYLRSDMVQTVPSTAVDPFKGLPENDWQVPDYLKVEEKPARCECSKCRQEREKIDAEEQPSDPANTQEGSSAQQAQAPPQQDTSVAQEIALPGEASSTTLQADQQHIDADATQNEKQPEDNQSADSKKPASTTAAEPTAMETDGDEYQNISPESYEIDYFTSGYYRGTLHKGYMHGKGRRIFSTGDIYEGDFKKDERHGQGHQVYQNGDKYEGDWAGDKPHGAGTWTTAATGNVYRGGFKSGKQHGEFILAGKRAESLKGCLVCYVEERDAVFYPCGHMCACLECARKLEDCPYCHRSISESIRLYTI